MCKTLSALLLVFAAFLPGEIIDRVVVTIGNRVITESEIDRQIRITAFLNGEKLDLSPAKKQLTIDRLVEQALIRREIETSRYIAASAVPEPLYAQLGNRYKDDADFKRGLADYGIGAQDVREAFEWQATLLEFVAIRFRPGVQLTEAELKEYFDTELAPKLAAAGEKVSFEDAREKVESILTQQRVDNAVDRWLGQVRTQSRIRYNREAMR